MISWILALVAPAVADTPVGADLARAEYQRVSTEIIRLSERNAWSGVERDYQAVIGDTLNATAQVHLIGAQAARQRGDITEARTRLRRAAALADRTPEVTDWLTHIDSTYAPVLLLGDVGKVHLSVAQMPFTPEHAGAIRFAIAQVDDTGQYDGLLPEGTFTFGGVALSVRPGISSERIDLRSDRTLRRIERAERRAASR